MTNKKNNDVKKPEEVVLNNPFDPAYQRANRTEPIEDDPFVNGNESTNKEQYASSKKHKKKYCKKYYGGEIGDSAQYPGGHI